MANPFFLLHCIVVYQIFYQGYFFHALPEAVKIETIDTNVWFFAHMIERWLDRANFVYFCWFERFSVLSNYCQKVGASLNQNSWKVT